MEEIFDIVIHLFCKISELEYTSNKLHSPGSEKLLNNISSLVYVAACMLVREDCTDTETVFYLQTQIVSRNTFDKADTRPQPGLKLNTD